MTKKCERCGTEKDESDFVLSKIPGYHQRLICSECRKERIERRTIAENNVKLYHVEYRAKNREKKNRKQILKKFNLTDEQYSHMIEKQNGCCAICGSKVPLAIDHCHSTGKIRGMLCRPCNTAIGMLKDNPHIMQSALDYCLSGGVV